MAPINEAAEVLEQLAARPSRPRGRDDYQGDHARIQESVNATGPALHDALAQVAQAVEQVSSASARLRPLLQAVASGASEQAASLEETTPSIESVSRLTKQAGDNAQQPNQLAKAAHRRRPTAPRRWSRCRAPWGVFGQRREHLADHQGHQRHRLPDEPARPERGGGGRTRRRGGARLRGGRRGGPVARAAGQGGGHQDRGAHPAVGEGDGAGRGDGEAGRPASSPRSRAASRKVSDIVAEIASRAQAQSTGIEQVTRP